MERTDEWTRARARARNMLVALDFDGTLSPIVERPGEAVLLPEISDAIVQLIARNDTAVAVVSGRGLEDVRARVGIPGLYYAGNHGLEIEGPGVATVVEAARHARPVLEHRIVHLRETIGSIEGVEIEDKELTASIHYRRLADPAREAEVIRAVREAVADEPTLRVHEGKKVVEIRPAVEWNKGHATRFLLSALQMDPGLGIPTLFIGDDVTDEDAFTVVRDHGAGIIVAATPPERTAATAWLRDPTEVAALLGALSAVPHSDG